MNKQEENEWIKKCEAFAKYSPVEEIYDELLEKKQIRLLIKRDDKIHPEISGNKWRKLKYNLGAAKKGHYKRLLTFGGAYSNHLYAVAAAGKHFGFETIGVIRGEELSAPNPTLAFAKKCGMHLHFISRQQYRKKENEDFINEIRELFGRFYLLPEGGTNPLALQGCAEIVNEIKDTQANLPDYFCLACGTGGTVAGVINGLAGTSKCIGFSVLKGDFHRQVIPELWQTAKLPIYNNWQINTDYHFGGYAKFKDELIIFINSFYKKQGIKLDPIYTGKLFFGVFDLIKRDYFEKKSTVLCVHSGGLQGIAGFNQRFGKILEL